MKFRQKPTFGYIMIGLALVLLTLAAFTVDLMMLLIGAMNGFIGVSMLARDIVEITQDEILIKNLLGMTMRRIPFGGMHQISIEQGKVFLNQGGETRPVRALNARSIRKEDWQQLEHELGIGELGKED